MSDPARAVEQAAEEAVKVDIQRIMEMIPHRHPFLMIDKVIEVVSNVRATGIKNVSINEQYFQGHFPSRPVMPGVLIIEAMAQTAAVLVVHTLGPSSEGKLVYFMSVDNARFRRPVFPGDCLNVRVVKQRNRGNVWKFEGRAEVGGQLMAEAVFAAMIMDD
jgi:3-hydroxyacyl-[acyl-carrier-protein] dehydratase